MLPAAADVTYGNLDEMRAAIGALAAMTGTRVDLLDRAGRTIVSADATGEVLDPPPATAAGLAAVDLAGLERPSVLEVPGEKGARTCLLPAGPYVVALCDAERRRRDAALLASVREWLPLVAKIVGGEGVLFDGEGLRLANVDGTGAPNPVFDGQISKYALQAMQEHRVVIGPSTSTPGAMAVRIPITGAFGIGFNNERSVLQRIKLQEQLNRDRAAKYTFDDVVGTSAALGAAKELAAKASQTSSTVLLVGETGTGKEVFAHAIHNASARADKPFVAINCGAIPHSLVESTLFGYVKGAFTGAHTEGNAGIFEQANGGTLSLDEISEMDFQLQAKLLRVLEDREVTRVGGKKPIKVDVRIIASTNKDLERLVDDGKFRHDLLFRLDVVRVNIPPLREHRDDVLPIARFLLQQLNRTLGTYALHLEPAAASALVAYAWPGNVRELRNCLEVALNTLLGDTIALANLPYRLRAAVEPASARRTELPPGVTLKEALGLAERQHIERVLATVGGNRQRAAEILGISTVTLWRKLQDA